jgi:hypothetical protein
MGFGACLCVMLGYVKVRDCWCFDDLIDYAKSLNLACAADANDRSSP